MAEKNLIKVYVNASSSKRVNLIIKNYNDFMGIVEGYTEGLRYMIECEKESNHRTDGSISDSQSGRLWCRSEGERGKHSTGNNDTNGCGLSGGDS